MTIQKRTVVLILCFGLLLSLLSGCGAASPSPTEPSAQIPAATAPPVTEPPTQPPATVPADCAEIPQSTGLQPWPAAPWSVNDWVSTGMDETFTWEDAVGNTCSVSISLPQITPAADFAVEYNTRIQEYGSRILQEIQDCIDTGTSNMISSVSFEAYLSEDILSILVIEETTIDLIYYTADSFDLEDREPVGIAELCDEYLDLDYPAFLMGTNTMITREFTEKYAQAAEIDPAFYSSMLDHIAKDTVSMLDRDLYVGENGQLMLVYNAPSMAGASYYPAVIPFSRSKIGWDAPPTEREAYDYFFTLITQSDGAYATACESLLRIAFEDDEDDFSGELARRSQDEIDSIAYLLALSYTDETDRLLRLTEELEEPAVRQAILSALEQIP